MRHASPAAMDDLEPLLSRLRALGELAEKKRGVFYRRSRAFLHFHEDPSGLYADVRFSTEFERFRVHTADEQEEFLTLVQRALRPGSCRSAVSVEAVVGAEGLEPRASSS